MSYVFLKNIFALVLLLCFTTSCAGLGTDIMEGWVDPTPVDKRTVFPREKAWFDARTPTLSRACRQGALTGKNIRDKATLRQYAAASYSNVPLAETSPDGKRKIYKLYLTWRVVPPPDPLDFYLRQWDYYGFSFTIHTNDEDIITECRVTKQFIGKGRRSGRMFE